MRAEVVDPLDLESGHEPGGNLRRAAEGDHGPGAAQGIGDAFFQRGGGGLRLVFPAGVDFAAIRENPLEHLGLAPLPAAQLLQGPPDRRVGRLDPLLVAKQMRPQLRGERRLGQVRPPAGAIAQVNVDLHGQPVRPRLGRLDEKAPRLPIVRASCSTVSSGLSVFGGSKTRACNVSKGSET